jgi:uncharacterized protein
MKAGGLPRALLTAALLAAACAAGAQVAVPPLEHRVTDLTGTLSESQRSTLEKRLADLESRKGSQVAVLLVPSIQPETIEQYAIRVFEQWKLGRRKVDDGALLVIAKNDRKLRIEVGYGLEGAIPDAVAKRIVDEEIAPRFRQGDFYGGILYGTDRIAKLVEGEAMPPPSRAPPAGGARRGGGFSELWIWAFLALIIAGSVLRVLMGRLLAASVIASVAGLVTFLAFGAVTAAIIAFIAFLLTLFDSVGAANRWLERRPSTPGDGWSSGSGGGSSGSDSWSSGGSFSGGGGSSGGGGASGGW